MRKLVAVLSAILLLAFATEAKPKSHVYKATPEQVYASALRSIALHHKIQYTDEKSGVISFKTGLSMSAKGLDCNAIISKGKPGEAEMIINVQKTNGQVFAWGAGDRLAEDIFKWVQEDLDKKQ